MNEQVNKVSDGGTDVRLADHLKQLASKCEIPLPRKLANHKTNICNDLLDILVVDAKGPGGANHQYAIYWPQGGPGRVQFGSCMISFQNGAIKENGVNGITQEALLAIVEDRLDAFQQGPYACEENERALTHIREAMAALKSRTTKRQERGVEGTMTV
jgi:hypothetical protein